MLTAHTSTVFRRMEAQNQPHEHATHLPNRGENTRHRQASVLLNRSDASGSGSKKVRRSRKKLPKTFILKLKYAEVVRFYSLESGRENASGSGFVNDLLSQLSKFPKLFSSRQDSVISELIACRELLSDRVMLRIPQLANRSRRDPVQMILFLIEKGLMNVDLATGPMTEAELEKMKINVFRSGEDTLEPQADSTLDESVPAYLNLKTAEVVDFLDAEGMRLTNKTVFMNQLLLLASNFPRVLSSPNDPFTHELAACERLLNDKIMLKIPQLAARSRRDPLQMILFLIEEGALASENCSTITI